MFPAHRQCDRTAIENGAVKSAYDDGTFVCLRLPRCGSLTICAQKIQPGGVLLVQQMDLNVGLKRLKIPAQEDEIGERKRRKRTNALDAYENENRTTSTERWL